MKASLPQDNSGLARFISRTGKSMTDTTAIETPAWRLWTPEGFREDDLWVHAESVDLADETNAGIILPLAQFLALPHETRTRCLGCAYRESTARQVQGRVQTAVKEGVRGQRV